MGDHIFICYARKDQSFVLRLATRLQSRGASVWLDQWNIPAGVNWNQNIDSALRDCGQFLIVLSPAAVASQQVQGELQMALDEKKPIVPVLRQACQVPRLLRLIQHIDFTGYSPDDVATLDRLVSALRLPEVDSLPQRGRPVIRHSRCLWRYGTVGGFLVLGMLIVWLLLLLSSTPVPTEEVPNAVRKVPVSVSTYPSGVNVYQDDGYVSTTPWIFNATVGARIRAVLKREGFQDREIDFLVNNYENEYSYRMDKRSGR